MHGRVCRWPIVLAALVLSPAASHADCPALRGGAPWYERLDRAAKQPGAPSDLRSLLQRDGFPPFGVRPAMGPAPLTVEVGWAYQPVENPLRIEIDADGDGTPEWVQAAYDAVPRTYTYAREGRYQLTALVYERGGGIARFSAAARVMSPAAFDLELEGRWADMHTALRRGDSAAALECVHGASRGQYRQIFESLVRRGYHHGPSRPTLVERRPDEMIYTVPRAVGGRVHAYEIRFLIDEDGEWRISSF
ncbi:MAG: hypothetical protein A3E31_02430 [Candidatus Rokubacteria bacterium RIFCSPHIGHO2_12_FULL_73_22]|nr:MAG: hypothetical protein A3D33_08415 [Candidatus Rokubacteria bacterium RIFCSPHIGHO2_02_FULL_73_26]OGL00606.1 MAG: hypothetical protein A3E31_02430 [Candidatus Rokubacteria bacterium RIFCSPHIGHO2_12_FULL_73_22]OGL11230.1 MAG: hypothetical protein A3I14_03315 [Candidatus Rokubacteria bacterium RIFCSPLOWO2_02_FULL_73_56]OGL21300.1 MAG: hypothetical protein A3G44_15220 [Candidatus Rokubacteria bacterium RIFCSPLOWO2_12_FULL_73_47]